MESNISKSYPQVPYPSLSAISYPSQTEHLPEAAHEPSDERSKELHGSSDTTKSTVVGLDMQLLFDMSYDL